jgi:hypothetical protein
VHLKRDNPQIRLRLDIENGDKHIIREELKDQLGEERLQKLKTEDWEAVDASYAYLAKSVPLDLEDPDNSVRAAAHELHQLREIIESHIETIAANHQPD